MTQSWWAKIGRKSQKWIRNSWLTPEDDTHQEGGEDREEGKEKKREREERGQHIRDLTKEKETEEARSSAGAKEGHQAGFQGVKSICVLG